MSKPSGVTLVQAIGAMGKKENIPVKTIPTRQGRQYWHLRREQKCVRCWQPSRPGKAECADCAGRHSKNWVCFQRTCLGPCGRTLRFDPTMTESIVRHHCKACGKVTGWRRVAV